MKNDQQAFHRSFSPTEKKLVFAALSQLLVNQIVLFDAQKDRMLERMSEEEFDQNRRNTVELHRMLLLDKP